MRLLLLALSISFSIAINAKVLKAYQYDNNKDSKVDSTHFYSNKSIVKIQRDLNYDGDFDHIRNYDIEGLLYQEKIDLDFDKEFEIRKDVFKKEDKLHIKKFNILKKIPLLVSHKILNILHTKEENCHYIDRNTVLADITAFVKQFESTISKSSGDYSKLENYRIDNGCISNYGKKNFAKILKKANKQGLECLSKLATEESSNKNQVEVFNLLNLMDSSLKNNTWEVTISCSDKESFPEGENDNALAQASIAQTVHNGIEHPFILVNPHKKTGFFGNISKDELTGVLFHEMIHNYGYSHGEGIDLAYGCEVCCFPDEFSKEAIKVGCNICKGDYKSETDEKYIKDLSLLSFHSKLVAGKSLFSANYKQLKTTKITKASFMASVSTFHPELLHELNLLTEAVTEDFDKELFNKLNRLQTNKHGNELLAASAKQAANLINSIFFKKDKKDTIKYLKSIDLVRLNQVPFKHSQYRSYQGGKSMLKSLRTTLEMALESESDAKLRKLYRSKLFDLKLLL